MELNFNDRHVDLIEDGFDLVIRNGPLRHGSGLKARCVARQRTRLYAAPQYLQRHGTPMEPEDFHRHEAIVYAGAGRLHSWLFPRADAMPRELTPPARLRFDDLESIAEAAAARFGLAWLPDWLARDRVRTGQLVQLLPDVMPLATDIYVVWPDAPHVPSRVRIAIDTLGTEMPGALSGTT